MSGERSRATNGYGATDQDAGEDDRACRGTNRHPLEQRPSPVCQRVPNSGKAEQGSGPPRRHVNLGAGEHDRTP